MTRKANATMNTNTTNTTNNNVAEVILSALSPEARSVIEQHYEGKVRSAIAQQISGALPVVAAPVAKPTVRNTSGNTKKVPADVVTRGRQHTADGRTTSQWIRDFDSKNPNTPAADVVAAAAKEGLNIAPALVYNVRQNVRNSQTNASAGTAAKVRKDVNNVAKLPVAVGTRGRQHAADGRTASQWIRDFDAQNPNSSADNVVAAAAKDGLNIAASLVYNVRQNVRNSQKTAAAAPAPRNLAIVAPVASAPEAVVTPAPVAVTVEETPVTVVEAVPPPVATPVVAAPVEEPAPAPAADVPAPAEDDAAKKAAKKAAMEANLAKARAARKTNAAKAAEAVAAAEKKSAK